MHHWLRDEYEQASFKLRSGEKKSVMKGICTPERLRYCFNKMSAGTKRECLEDLLRRFCKPDSCVEGVWKYSKAETRRQLMAQAEREFVGGDDDLGFDSEFEEILANLQAMKIAD